MSPTHHSVHQTLAETDSLLAEVVRELADGWHARTADPVPVLPQDLPELLLGWLLPAGGKRLRGRKRLLPLAFPR